jgi:hypothetical protein
MHEGAFQFVSRVAMRLEPRGSVIELGSRTIAGPWPYSGPVRHLFAGANQLLCWALMAAQMLSYPYAALDRPWLHHPALCYPKGTLGKPVVPQAKHVPDWVAVKWSL